MPCWDGLTRLEEGGLSLDEIFKILTQHCVTMTLDRIFYDFAESEVKRKTMKEQ